MLFNRPSVHDNTLSVFIENSSMWKRSWRWIKTKTHTCGRSKTLPARVFIARAQSSTYVATCNSIVWNVLEWTLENAWKLKCVRESIDAFSVIKKTRTFENALVWTGPKTRALTSQGGGRGVGTPDFKWHGWSNECKNQNPKKIPRASNKTPLKNPLTKI